MTGPGLQALAALPPGPALAGVLEGLDTATLTEEQAVPVLQAWSRQRAHDHARMAATLARVAALSRQASGPAAGEWAGSEIAAALTWTERRAGYELEFAEELAALPLVAAAFDEGRIDSGKAAVFTDVLGPAELTAQQIEVLCATYLLVAPGLTSGQLRHRLTRALLAVDPEAAARRYRRAVTRRGVVGYLSADGTAVISASGLPAEQAAAACARIDELAAQLRRVGHPGTINQIRADVLLRLLDGSLTGFTTAEIIATLLADAATVDDPSSPATTPAASPVASPAASPAASPPASPATSPATEAPADAADGHPDTGSSAAWDAESPAAADGAPHATQATPPGAAASAEHADDPPEGGSPASSGAESPAAAEEPPASQPAAQARPAGVEIRVGLATLLGIDQRPGEIPGWGPVIPEVARELVARSRQARWRFAVVDDEGYLLRAGTTRHRPSPADPPRPPVTAGLVELHVTARLLAALAHDPTAHPAWAAVITDIAAQFADRTRLAAALDAHPDSRHARGPLLRHIQVRDRTCVAPGCRRPARACDVDHTCAYAEGGATTTANTGPLCPRHHTLKHRAGWRLHQPRPGHFHWISPLAQHYHTRGEPIMPPLPAPHPDLAPPDPSRGPSREIDIPTYQPRPRPIGEPPAPRRRWSDYPAEDPDNAVPF